MSVQMSSVEEHSRPTRPPCRCCPGDPTLRESLFSVNVMRVGTGDRTRTCKSDFLKIECIPKFHHTGMCGQIKVVPEHYPLLGFFLVDPQVVET